MMQGRWEPMTQLTRHARQISIGGGTNTNKHRNRELYQSQKLATLINPNKQIRLTALGKGQEPTYKQNTIKQGRSRLNQMITKAPNQWPILQRGVTGLSG